MRVLDDHIDQIRQLCDAHNVKSLFAFGSVLTERFDTYSDIDLLVDINVTDPIVYTEHYFALKDELEIILNKPVDLLEERALNNPFFKKQIDLNKMLVYGS